MAGAIQINSTEIISESGGTVTLKNITTDATTDISASLGSLFATTAQVQGTHTTFNGSHSDGATTINLASVSGITVGDYVVGEGILPGTTVSSIGESYIVISQGLDTDTVGIYDGEPISFYIANKTLSPGLVAGQLCRAWANFNGTGTVAIRASGNVSSITDNGTGDYTVNFATAMPGADYCVVLTGGRSADAGNAGGDMTISGEATPLTTTSVTINSYRNVNSGTAVANDVPFVCVAIFR